MATPGVPIERVFLDTNVLIYAFDRAEPEKSAIANKLVQKLLNEGRMALSTQVLNEFYWATTRQHRSHALTHADAARIVRDLASDALAVSFDVSLTLLALDAVQNHKLAFWDALILEAARTAGCTQLSSEDFQHGQTIGGVKIVNPFA